MIHRLLFLLIPCILFSATISESESNNNCSSADAITIFDTGTGIVAENNDPDDYWVFTTPSSAGNLRIYTTGYINNTDSDGYLYSSTNCTNYLIRDYRTNPDVDLTYNVTKNTTYYFRMNAYNRNNNPYVLNFTFTSNNHAPTITQPNNGNAYALSVPENTTSVTDINATDSDNDTLTYTLSGTDASHFAINASTGVITFATTPDYESPEDANADNIYNITVTVTDNGYPAMSDAQNITVTVNNINDNLVIITDSNSSTNSVPENASIGTPVGITVSASDADTGATITSYRLTDTANGRFAIDPTTHIITVAGVLDYETATSHTITVEVNSSDGSSATQSFTINVTDIQEVPMVDYRFDECQWIGTTGEVEDNSTNGYNATPKSANGSNIPQVSAQIINNGALFVRANQQYVELPTIAQSTPNFNDGFTVTAWAKFSGSAGFWERIFDIGNGTDINNIFLGRQGTTNNLVLGIHDPGTSQYLVANGAISDTNWHFWGATCDGNGGCKLYKDGVKIAESTTMKIPANVSRTKNYIGKSNWSADAYLEGGVDELKFFDAMLSDAEITTIYTNESSGKNYDGTTRSSVDCDLKPVADYRFDECKWDGTTEEVKDNSGNDLNGTIQGTAQTTMDGLLDNGGVFDNSAGNTDAIVIPDSDLLSPHIGTNGEITISAWVKLNAYPSTALQGRIPIVAKGDDNKWEYALYVYQDHKAGFSVWQSNGSSYKEISGGNLALNTWYHISGVLKKGNVARVYVNGNLVVESTSGFNGTTTDGTSPLYIARRGSGNNYLDGYIDEVKIFDKALSQTQVTNIYSNELAGNNFDGTPREASCCCVPTGGNLIANPSFETLCSTSIVQAFGNVAGGIVNMRDNVCGWTMNGNGMETWENTTSPAANDGAVFVEIDGDGTTVDQLSQTIKTLNEIHYVISFDYRARNGGSDRIIAKWNGVEIDTFTGITSEWQTAQIEVVGTGSDTLAFEEPSADNNSYGSWIDNVRLIEGTLSPQNFGFDAWDSFRSISDRNISTKIVGKDFNLTIASLNDEKTGFQDFNGTVCVALVNNSAQPISGWNKLFFNDQNTSLTTLVLDKAIGGDESAGVQITWKKNVDVLCPLVGESNSTIASDRFAVRPERFSITTLSNPIAGVDFNLTFSAPIFDSNTPASDYNETVGDTFDVTIAEQNASCITGVLTPNNLLFSFENGTQTLLTRYSEVGKLDINITETTKPCGSRFAQIDCDDANVFDGTALTQDILPIASENMTISVIPHHFDLNATLKNGNNTYTYLSTDLNMSASLDLLISAKNFQNEVTQNYSDACYAQSTSYTVDYAPLTISPSGSLKKLIYHYLDTENIDINETSFTLDANRSIFSAGEGSISLNFNFDRNETKPVNPFTFTLNSVNVIDSDNVTGEDPTDQNATFVFGRTHAYDMTTNDTEAPNPIEIEIYGKNSSHSFLVGKPQNTIYWYRNTDHNGVLGGAVLSGDDYPSTTKTGASSSIVVTTATPPAGGLQWINIQNNDSITTPKTIHLSIDRWLWYSSLQSYSDLDGSNCTQHPCFKYNFTVDSSSTTTPFRGSDFNIAPAQDVTQKGAKFFR